MSRTNREREYNRLVKLGREKDICPALMAEFAPAKAEPIPEKPEKKRGKK